MLSSGQHPVVGTLLRDVNRYLILPVWVSQVFLLDVALQTPQRSTASLSHHLHAVHDAVLKEETTFSDFAIRAQHKHYFCTQLARA
jgi:hypothetical protein